jgi:hypothetical protein
MRRHLQHYGYFTGSQVDITELCYSITNSIIFCAKCDIFVDFFDWCANVYCGLIVDCSINHSHSVAALPWGPGGATTPSVFGLAPAVASQFAVCYRPIWQAAHPCTMSACNWRLFVKNGPSANVTAFPGQPPYTVPVHSQFAPNSGCL